MCTCNRATFKMLSCHYTIVRVCWSHKPGEEYSAYSGLSPRYFGTADFALNEVLVAQRLCPQLEKDCFLHEIGHILARSMNNGTGYSEAEADLTVVWFLAATKALETFSALWTDPSPAMLQAGKTRRAERNF